MHKVKNAAQTYTRIVAALVAAVFTLMLAYTAPAQNPARMTVEQLWNLPNYQLVKLLNQSTQDTVRLKILLALSTNLEVKPGSFKADIDSALHYLGQAGQLSRQLHRQHELVEVHMRYGLLYYHTEQIAKARNYFNKGIELSRQAGDKDHAAYLYLQMGRNEMMLEDKLRCLDQSLQLYREVHNRSRETEVLKEIADVHLNQGKYDQAEAELNQVLATYKSQKYDKIYFTYDLLSALYHRKGDFNRALAFSNEAVRSAEQAKDSIVLGIFYWRLGEAYQDANNNAGSLQALEHALTILVKNPGPLLYHALEELVDQLIKAGQVKKALGWLQMVNKRRPPTDVHDQIALSFAMADCYVELKNNKLAEYYYLKYANVLGNGDDYFGDIIKLCRFYISQRRYDKAGVYLQKLQKDDQSNWDLSRRRDVYMLAFKVDSATGNQRSAIQNLQQYIRFNDSIFTVEKVKQAEELQVKFNLADKEKDNQLLRDKSALQARALEKDKLVNSIIIAGCVVLLGITLLLYSRYRTKMKTNAALQRQQHEIRQAYTELEKLIDEKNQLIGDKEFLLKEIHHRVKNNLQLTMSLLNSQSRYLDNEAAIKAIKDSQHRLKSISLVHQKLYQSADFGRIGIQAYIHEIIAYLKDSFNAGERIRFELDVEDIELDAGKAVPLGLFLNEAVTNIFKYAFPDSASGRVYIRLNKVGEQVNLTIADNGVGLPGGFEGAPANSLGITLMKGLSAQLDGSFTIASSGGVQVSLVFNPESSYFD